jgi:hypothetical protein
MYKNAVAMTGYLKSKLYIVHPREKSLAICLMVLEENSSPMTPSNSLHVCRNAAVCLSETFRHEALFVSVDIRIMISKPTNHPPPLPRLPSSPVLSPLREATTLEPYEHTLNFPLRDPMRERPLNFQG